MPSTGRGGDGTVSDTAKPRSGIRDYATGLVRRICRIAGDPHLITTLSGDLARHGVQPAIQRRDNTVLFDWLVETISYQGIGNHVAHGYMERHGRVRWYDIAALLDNRPSCPKLPSYWHFDRCGYRKLERSCNKPEHFAACPLPSHDLRNGRLNQAAYSLFLFIRDVADGDLVGWVDRRLANATSDPGPDRTTRLRQALIEPLSHVHGVSSKVLSMALADLLLGGDPERALWTEAGAVMIAVDTLVHNFLHRTGILRRLRATHGYGPACYGSDGCAVILDRIAATVDARQFNPAFPRYFPRFVQNAVWRFCAEGGLDECNGRQIDDRKRCSRRECPVFRLCGRVTLKPQKELSHD
jgi:hypothetical protein